MSKKRFGILLGVLAVGTAAGGIGYYYYTYKKNKGVPAGFDKFVGLRLGDAASVNTDCAGKCALDPACTGYAVNRNTGECRMAIIDPITSWVEDDAWDLFVKRGVDDAPSSWGEWAPVVCPEDGRQGRSCTGKCPGNSTRACKPTPPFFEDIPAGYFLDPLPSDVEGSVTNAPAKDMAECKDKCAADKNCVACKYVDAQRTCELIGPPYKIEGLRAADRDWYIHSLAVKSRPGWGKLPDGNKPCECGKSYYERECATPPCDIGISRVRCPSSPCQYDVFNGMKV